MDTTEELKQIAKAIEEGKVEDYPKINSIHFDCDKDLLEINGHCIEIPIIVEWPEEATAKAWPRKKMINSDKIYDFGKEKFVCGGRLPCLHLSFSEGTGVFKAALSEVNNML